MKASIQKMKKMFTIMTLTQVFAEEKRKRRNSSTKASDIEKDLDDDIDKLIAKDPLKNPSKNLTKQKAIDKN